MNNIVITALKNEHADLLWKLTAVEDTLAAYGALEKKTIAVAQDEALRAKHVMPSRSPAEKTQKIRALSKSFLAPHLATPTRTRDILAHIEENGIAVGGKNPVVTLSATLSNSKEFHSIGRKGWVLSEYAEGSDAVTSEPSKESEGAHPTAPLGQSPAHHRPQLGEDSPQ